MKAQLCPSDLSTPCPRRNLRLCISSLMKTLPQVSSDLLSLPMEPWSSSFGKKMALFDFALTSEASTESPRKTDIHYPSFLTSYTHHKSHGSIPKLIFSMHTISFSSHPETNGRLLSELAM